MSHVMDILELIEADGPPGYKLEADFRDYHSGDNYGSIYAHKDGNVVGHLDFAGNKHSVQIQHIGVHPDHARKGLAMAMISHLTDEHFKGAKLDWGMTTPDGTKLRTAWEKHHPLPGTRQHAHLRSKTGMEFPRLGGSRFAKYDPDERQHHLHPFIPYRAKAK